MATSKIDNEIRERIDSFIGELSQLVKDAALEAVQEALGGGQAPARRSNTKKTSGDTVATARKAAQRKGKRHRRTAADLENMADRIFDHVKSNPGQRMEVISAALGERTYDLRRPLEQLKTEKVFKTTGQKRATQYYVRAGAKKRAK